MERHPAPWLARALAERWARDTWEYLRLLASAPGVTVSEELVPLRDRLDLDAIQSKFQRTTRAAQHLLKQARESGAPVYPPGD
jgi:hypothetical protein